MALLWTKFPRSEITEDVSRLVAAVEGQSGSATPVAKIDFTLTLAVAVLLFGSLLLIQLAEWVALFARWCAAFILQEPTEPTKVNDSPPGWKWFAAIFGSYAVSVGILRLYGA